MFSNPWVVLAVLAIVGIGLGIYHYLNRNTPGIGVKENPHRGWKINVG